jgi:hypothetical protein
MLLRPTSPALALLGSVFFASSAFPRPAQAESCGGLDPLPARCQSYSFVAEVTTVGDPALLFEVLSVGDTISGTFTLDMDVEDANPANADGFYADAVKCATVDFPSGRSLEIRNDDFAPGEERHILVENDRPQALGGGFNAFTDNVAGTLGGLARIVGGQIPADQWINAAGALGFGYSKACIQGFQTPCPPTVIDDDSIPGPPGDVTGLDAALLEFQVQELPGPSSAIVFSDLESIDATDPVRCPEPGIGVGLAASALAAAGLAQRRASPRRSPRTA